MPLTSDLQLDKSKFDPQNISEQTKKFNDNLIKIMNAGPKWMEVGAEKYRQMRWNGETPMPKPTVLPHGQNSSLPSRDPSRRIPIRVFPAPQSPPSGVFYHIHGGGWVLQSEAYQDLMLSHFSTHANLTVISVGYRLAPEYPYPAGNEDCVDVGRYLIEHAEREYGAEMKFIGGDSAGAHLSVLTCFELLESREGWQLEGGLVLNFGVFDLAGMLPMVHCFDQPLVIDREIMEGYISAYLPHTTPQQRRDPKISPFYRDLTKVTHLPPAIFSCGTLDPLLDDSVMMCAKWQMAGGQAVLKIYPGAPHGFTFFPPGGTERTEENLRDIVEWMGGGRLEVV